MAAEARARRGDRGRAEPRDDRVREHRPVSPAAERARDRPADQGERLRLPRREARLPGRRAARPGDPGRAGRCGVRPDRLQVASRVVAYEFKLPDLGEGLTEGEVAKWLV